MTHEMKLLLFFFFLVVSIIIGIKILNHLCDKIGMDDSEMP